MLVYLWFRFELIYGVAAVVAVFHDTLITIGAFSLTNQEITLTVIAAILTLIGYSMNDTVVVFDRIRENLAMSRRESLSDVVNRVDQPDAEPDGAVFRADVSDGAELYLFGGEVLHGFSFALVVGILIGTYSSIAVAAPMLVAWQDYRVRQGKAAATSAGGTGSDSGRSRKFPKGVVLRSDSWSYSRTRLLVRSQGNREHFKTSWCLSKVAPETGGSESGSRVLLYAVSAPDFRVCEFRFRGCHHV